MYIIYSNIYYTILYYALLYVSSLHKKLINFINYLNYLKFPSKIVKQKIKEIKILQSVVPCNRQCNDRKIINEKFHIYSWAFTPRPAITTRVKFQSSRGNLILKQRTREIFSTLCEITFRRIEAATIYCTNHHAPQEQRRSPPEGRNVAHQRRKFPARRGEFRYKIIFVYSRAVMNPREPAK